MPAGSSQLERREGEERAEDAEDPEADDDLGLLPSLHLEVVVQRRAQEYPVRARVVEAVLHLAMLEDTPLDDHRGGFRDEDAADDQQQELGLEQDRDDPKRATQGERAGVS